MRRLILVALFLAACGRNSELAEVAKETLDAARPTERVQIQVRLEKAELPSEEDVKVRRAIEEQIEGGNIGRLVASGGGVGHFDITLDVDSTADAIPRINAILVSEGLASRASIRVLNQTRTYS